MAVAFDARSEGENNTSATSLTVSHTCTGSDRVLYVFAWSGSGLVDISTVTGTYNGTSMAIKFTGTDQTNRPVRVFRLVAPSTGANNIVLSWSGNDYVRLIGASFTGVDQTTPDDAQVWIDGSGGGTSSSGNVTSATGNMVVDIVYGQGNGVTGLTAGAGQTEVNQMTADASGAGRWAGGVSYESGAATTTMSWSWNEFAAYAGYAFDINQSSGGGGRTAKNTRNQTIHLGLGMNRRVKGPYA